MIITHYFKKLRQSLEKHRRYIGEASEIHRRSIGDNSEQI